MRDDFARRLAAGMRGFQILFHGTFSTDDPVGRGDRRFGGLYTSRIILAPDEDAAVLRGKELVRSELEETILRGKPQALSLLEAEEIQTIRVDETTIINRRGFTFY
jgi:hypothetical protein